MGTACGTWQVAQPLRDPQPQPLYGKEDASPGLEGPQEGHLGYDVHWRALGQEVETWARGTGLSPCAGSSGKSFSLSELRFPFYKMSQLAPQDTFPDSMSWGPTYMGVQPPSLCKAEVAHEPLSIAGLLPASGDGATAEACEHRQGGLSVPDLAPPPGPLTLIICERSPASASSSTMFSSLSSMKESKYLMMFGWFSCCPKREKEGAGSP